MKLPRHLKFIATLPCVICGDSTQTQCAHVRFADPRLCKPESGMGRKPNDWCCVPLCGTHHTEQHCVSEKSWWASWDLDAHFISMALYVNSGDYNKCCYIIEYHQLHSLKCSDLRKASGQNNLKR